MLLSYLFQVPSGIACATKAKLEGKFSYVYSEQDQLCQFGAADLTDELDRLGQGVIRIHYTGQEAKL